jgi:hypothetical protein
MGKTGRAPDRTVARSRKRRRTRAEADPFVSRSSGISESEENREYLRLEYRKMRLDDIQ